MRFRTNLEYPKGIYTYLGRHLHSIDPLTGETIWDVKLPKVSRIEIVAIESDSETVYVLSVSHSLSDCQ